MSSDAKLGRLLLAPIFVALFVFLFFLSSFSVVFANDVLDGRDAAMRGDYETAYKIWLPLAEQGDSGAQINLAILYHRGLGIPQAYKKAVKWYQLSAEQGIAQAQSNLATMYSLGTGVPQDSKEAVKWSRLAAEQGHPAAIFNLGQYYYEGSEEDLITPLR